ncbi:Protein of pXO2-46 [Staphylococcus piscifermentans]|uniref:CAAX prenyl protease 2/Lysostaphin resistance protein A-like domain-containing protein n=1 Tax=Staphylococcus piscifermentans TaxID=70258 RepID=A0A239TR46_9STAP|nr:CPBP family intramembrane glutamic endopeptidase [Staphylococcus piscifermentans]RTX84121.1 CPBP family intramembrane metalloprotease [Staphylococcus piscifermentans]GEP84461.1 hypothetical protein SPI02_10460 [Staphylococcus piscifermentans]SNU99063.1 Protein of pXO2-46 [Staphylococcus piscifermentans]
MINNPFDSPKVMKRDFGLIPLYFLLLNVGQVIVLGVGLIVIETFHMKIPHNSNAIASGFGDIISFSLLFYIFYKMHQSYIIPIVLERIKQAKAYIWLVIITYIVYLIIDHAYSYALQFLPKHYQFEESQNQSLIIQQFDTPWLWPVLFLTTGILGPIAEELIFRHVLIHELGKKITYIGAAVLSTLFFAVLHLHAGSSPFEFIPYLYGGFFLVFVYLKSGKNLAVSCMLHILNNSVITLSIIYQQLFQ